MKKIFLFLLIFFLPLLANCSLINSRIPITATSFSTNISFQTPTLQLNQIQTVTLTPVPSQTPVPTLTFTPTLTPQGLGLVYHFETIDPYQFYVENKGRFIIAYEDYDLPEYTYWLPTPLDFNHFREERGDNIFGNPHEGWHIIFDDRVIYIGPVFNIKDGYVSFIVRNGRRNSKGDINFITEKELTVTEGALVYIGLATGIRHPTFYYDPLSSTFLADLNTDIEKKEGWPPMRGIYDIFLLIRGEKILLTADYLNFPGWCLSQEANPNLRNQSDLIGYTINQGDLYYWGKDAEGSARCPIAFFEK